MIPYYLIQLSRLMPDKIDNKIIERSFHKLIVYLHSQDFTGYDPHDALNSSILESLFGRNHYSAILIVQLFRRSPINFRPIFGVKKGINPKSFGLFLSAFTKLHGTYLFDAVIAHKFADWLAENRASGYQYSCWGYNFDWPNRDFYAKTGTPTVVNTVFIGHSLLDYYQITKEDKWLNIAVSAANFILNDLNIIQQDRGICFSYTPFDHRCVHNANLLAAGYLARVSQFSEEKKFCAFAKKAISYSISKQERDGSWFYGPSQKDKWIDHFHTAFNLLSIYEYLKIVRDVETQKSLEAGYKYYCNNLFDNYIPKYFTNKLYPIDIHSIATSVITFLTLPFEKEVNRNRALQLLKWTVENMQDESGAFYYQKHKFYINKNIYMRWGQAWMLLALATYLSKQ